MFHPRDWWISAATYAICCGMCMAFARDAGPDYANAFTGMVLLLLVAIERVK